MSAKREEGESEDDLKNDEWFKKNYLNSMQEHPREWIAVMDRKTIATSSTRIEVEEKAKKIAGGQGISVYFVAPTGTFTDTGYSER